MDTEVLRELVQIKWWLVVFVTTALLLGAFRAWIEVRRSGGLNELLRQSLASRAKSLLEEDRAAELRALAEARFREAPADVYAFWYHAQAAHRLGDTTAALNSMRRVGQLQPDWREGYVEPFIRALDGKLAIDSGPAAQTPAPVDRGPTKPA